MIYIWSQHSSIVAVERWLGMVLAVLLLLICQGKEEVVLARLEDLELCIPLPGSLYGPVERHDPLNVTATIPKCKQLPPEQIMARSVIFLKICFQICIQKSFCNIYKQKGLFTSVFHKVFLSDYKQLG
jgi:hypothetical protein